MILEYRKGEEILEMILYMSVPVRCRGWDG